MDMIYATYSQMTQEKYVCMEREEANDKTNVAKC